MLKWLAWMRIHARRDHDEAISDKHKTLIGTNMTMRLSILPAGLECELQPGLSLLESCLLAGVSLPNSCRNGVCRTCMCKLLDGNISYQIPWPGLSLDEKQEAWILPCVAVPESSLQIESLCSISKT